MLFVSTDKVTDLFCSVFAQSSFQAVLYIDRELVDGRPQARNLSIWSCAWTGPPDRLDSLFDPGDFGVKRSKDAAEDGSIVGV